MKRAHLLGTLAAGAAAPSVLRAADLITLRIASSLEDTVRPLLYGMNAGVFRRLGLNIELA